jgi:hypothetical protein
MDRYTPELASLRSHHKRAAKHRNVDSKALGSHSGMASSTATLLDTRSLALLLGTSEQTLRQWRCAGVGPDYIKLGAGRKAAVRYTLGDVEIYIAQNRRASAVRAFVTEESNERF